MRSDKAVITYGGMVADMISTPESYIVSNSDKRLDGIVFENETIFSNGKIRPGRCFRTHVTC